MQPHRRSGRHPDVRWQYPMGWHDSDRALNSIAAELSKRRFRARFTAVSGNSLAHVARRLTNLRRATFRWDALSESATPRLADARRFPPPSPTLQKVNTPMLHKVVTLRIARWQGLNNEGYRRFRYNNQHRILGCRPVLLRWRVQRQNFETRQRIRGCLANRGKTVVWATRFSNCKALTVATTLPKSRIAYPSSNIPLVAPASS